MIIIVIIIIITFVSSSITVSIYLSCRLSWYNMENNSQTDPSSHDPLDRSRSQVGLEVALSILIYVTSFLGNLLVVYVVHKDSRLKNHNSSYFLRQSDFSTPSFNTVTYGKHSLRYLGPKLWGKLSPNVRSAETLNIFRKQIRKFDISLLIDDGCKGCFLCSS